MIFAKDIQVVVLMGGLGTRLQGYTQKCPKSMIDIQGVPFFHYQLELMKQAGFKKFLFLVGYKADMIEAYFGNGERFHVNIQYSYDGMTLRGTGGAICNAYQHLEEQFMVIYGDSFMDIDYTECLYRYSKGLSKGKDSLMAVYQNHNLLDKSNVSVERDQITLYDKHHPTINMSYIDYGIGIYTREIFKEYLQKSKLDLSEVQNKLTLEKRVSGYIAVKRFYEIGTQESLEQFKRYINERKNESKPAIFLDRDGVINEIVFNEETEQLDSPFSEKEFHFLPGVENAIKKLNKFGYYVFIITNQPASAKGKVSLEKLYDVNRYCILQLESNQAYVEDLYMCPHYNKALKKIAESFLIQNCGCRKPKTGLLERANKKYNIDKEKSFMIGDSYTDILAGRNFGIKTVLLGNMKCDICKKLDYDKPDYICYDLQDAVDKITDKGEVK